MEALLILASILMLLSAYLDLYMMCLWEKETICDGHGAIIWRIGIYRQWADKPFLI